MGTEGWESACWHQTQGPISLSNFSSRVPRDMEAKGTVAIWVWEEERKQKWIRMFYLS